MQCLRLYCLILNVMSGDVQAEWIIIQRSLLSLVLSFSHFNSSLLVSGWPNYYANDIKGLGKKQTHKSFARLSYLFFLLFSSYRSLKSKEQIDTTFKPAPCPHVQKRTMFLFFCGHHYSHLLLWCRPWGTVLVQTCLESANCLEFVICLGAGDNSPTLSAWDL